MTEKEKQTVNKIIKNLIDIAKDFDDGFDKEKLNDIIETYKSSECDITNSCYVEVNNLIDQQITLFLNDIAERQQVQEYITSVSHMLSELSKDENFKMLVDYIGQYIENHIITYSSILNGVEATAKIQKDYNKKLREARDDLIKAKDTIDNLLPNLLTVLSILISIVIAVVIVYITVFLEPGDETTVSLVDKILQAHFAKYVLSVHIVGDLFFIMMFMIARLTNRSILMTCSHFKWKSEIPDEYKDSYTTEFHRFACADCCTDCSFLKKLQRKSAYILYFNLLMFVLYAILYLWWILNHYVDRKNTFLFSGDFWFILSFAAVAIIGIVCFYLIRFFKNEKKTRNFINNAFLKVREEYNDVSFRKEIVKKELQYKYDLKSNIPISIDDINFDKTNEKITCIKYRIKKDFNKNKILLYDIKTKKIK